MRSRTEILLLVTCCGFLFFYGLGAFGLLGADEPRYAQVAREMLDRGDWVTPTLNGKPWLEKPPLYYWQAMLSYRVARTLLPGKEGLSVSGVSEKCARLPGAIDAALMIAAIYFFVRRLRPGVELDAALITTSCAGIIGFAHAASTDMPLTASFTVAMLAWYAWRESQRRLDLAIFYVALALGTLAKGPVAPALAAAIIALFAFARREWNVAARTLWIPGIALFLIVALPWYLAVQIRNPDFFRVFILEHNLARFSSNVYHHPEPFWFYLPVFLLATMPWTLWFVMAIAERVRLVWRERRAAIAGPDDSWPLFLILWVVVPIIFFSLSQSKLPGYILPAVPAATVLAAEYLAARRERQAGISFAAALAHGLLCAALIFAALSAPRFAYSRHPTWGPEMRFIVPIPALFAIAIAATLVTRAGRQMLRPVTLLAIIFSVGVLIRFCAPAIDATQSSRPIAEAMQGFSREPVPVALYHVGRTPQYGLDFYLNRATQSYDSGQIPAEAHLLLAPADAQPAFSALIPGRKVSYLTSLPARKLELYWVGKKLGD